MSDWYLKDASGAPSGPYATQAVLQWIAAGKVQIETSPDGRPRVRVTGAKTAFGLA